MRLALPALLLAFAAGVHAGEPPKDANGDGKVDLAEFGGDERLFRHLDRDGDGFLDPKELAEGVRGRRGARSDRSDRGERSDRSDRGDRGGAMAQRLKEMDTNGDGAISKEEWKGPEQSFQRLDRDQDGLLSAADLKEMVERMKGWRGNAGEALMRRADKDGDGRVSREEWPLPAMHFDRFDKDSDGFLTAEEMTPEGPRAGHRGGKGRDDLLARHDKDGDGKISSDEFPSERRFAEMDTDRDGFLTRAELDESFEKRSSERDYDFVEIHDRNGDGKVTRDEFPGPARHFDRLDRNADGIVDGADLKPR